MQNSASMSAKASLSALRGEKPAPKPVSPYKGKTYNSKEAIAEFFNNRNSVPTPLENIKSDKSVSGLDKLRAIATPADKRPDASALVAGSHVRHEKYGNGLILRREGSGDNVKLTVSFPGFGQKKLIEKYANLEKV